MVHASTHQTGPITSKGLARRLVINEQYPWDLAARAAASGPAGGCARHRAAAVHRNRSRCHRCRCRPCRRGGLAARLVGAPRWTPVATGAAAAVTARLAQWGSGLEPGARWLSLVEAWRDASEDLRPWDLGHSTIRRIQHAPFPFAGVAGWQGHRHHRGHGFDGRFALIQVRLGHGDPRSGPTVVVETNSRPGLTQVDVAAAEGDRSLRGEVTLQVDGRTVSFRRYAPPPDADHEWEAAGTVAGLGVSVEVTGLLPEQLRLQMGVDPTPYLDGRRGLLRDSTTS